jgi:hypothetical protein
MPGRDRSGPAGAGPMTGGGFGDCAGDPVVGAGAPRRFFGRWGGRGWRNWYCATGLTGWQRAGYTQSWGPGRWQAPAPDEEAAALRGQAGQLKSMLEEVEARLKDLEEDQGE